MCLARRASPREPSSVSDLHCLSERARRGRDLQHDDGARAIGRYDVRMTVTVEVADRHTEGLSEALVAGGSKKYTRTRRILQQHGHAARGGGSQIGNHQIRLAITVQVSHRDIDRSGLGGVGDRKSTRLNSSHDQISYAVFCLKKKKNKK